MNVKRYGMVLAALAVVLAVPIAACGSSDNAIETVSPVEASEVLNPDPDAVVLDIRTPDEFAQGIIDGAINVDFYAPDFAEQLDELDKDAHYIVYCRSGNRSGQAMATFADLGFAQVTEIDGGIVNWDQQELPVVAP